MAETGKPKAAADLHSKIFATVPFALKRHQSPHGRVTAVSMMKDEGPFLIEWVAHHLAIGFTDLLVYTNDCTDGTDEMLIRLEELGLAHHRRNDIPEGRRPQPSALNYAQKEPLVAASDWILVFDADEFVSITYGDGTLDDLIGAIKARGANGMVITWRIFGSGGVVDWSRAPVCEQYLRAAPPMWNKGWGVKTLFQFDPEHWLLGIHRPKIRNKMIDTPFPDTVRWLNGSGVDMPDYFKFRGWRSVVKTLGYDWVQMNHYALKSVDSYALRKLRGNVNFKKDKYNADYWSLQDRNEVYDPNMLRYKDRRDAIIEVLLGDPVLSRLHYAAVERAEARLAEIKATPAYEALKKDLAAASAVSIEEVTAKPPVARDRAEIARLMAEIESRRAGGSAGDAAGDEAAAGDGGGDSQPRAREKPPRPLMATRPAATYVAATTELPLMEDPAWIANHMIDLPQDPMIFAPNALAALAVGKFQRAVARRLPTLVPEGGRLLEIGSGVGFLALRLLEARPDATAFLHEEAGRFDTPRARIFARYLNDPAGKNRRLPEPVEDKLGKAPARVLAELVRRIRPALLMIGDPAVSAPDLAACLAGLGPDDRPARLLMHSRLIEMNFEQRAQYASATTPFYEDTGEFPADVAWSFRLAAPDGSAGAD